MYTISIIIINFALNTLGCLYRNYIQNIIYTHLTNLCSNQYFMYKYSYTYFD